MTKRKIHVWSESDGPADSGYGDGHTLGTHHGSAYAETLREAADEVFLIGSGLIEGYDHFNPCYDRERMTFYGYALFEREPQYV